jgi:hypothetical protein
VVLNKISFLRKRLDDDKVTPHPRDVVLKTVPPKRNPSTRSNCRESGPPTGNLNRRLVGVVGAISQSELGPPSNKLKLSYLLSAQPSRWKICFFQRLGKKVDES